MNRPSVISPSDRAWSPASPRPQHIWLSHCILAGRDVSICRQRCEFAAAVRARYPEESAKCKLSTACMLLASPCPLRNRYSSYLSSSSGFVAWNGMLLMSCPIACACAIIRLAFMAALSWSLCCFHLAFLEAAEADWALRESTPLQIAIWRTGNQKHPTENSMGQCAEACPENTGGL